MAQASTIPGLPLPSSISFVTQELRRIPRSVHIGLSKLGLSEDLAQELHLAYYESHPTKDGGVAVKKALHAAGERFRYKEMVRRAQREVPEAFAGASYHSLVYGEPSGPVE